MEALIYSIDDVLSKKTNTLVIHIQVAKKEDYLFSPLKIQPVLTQELLSKFSSIKDETLLSFLLKEEANFLKKTHFQTLNRKTTPINFIHVSFSMTLDLIKLFMISGKLYFKGKSLTLDPYGEALFFYLSEEKGVFGVIKLKSEEFKITSCDYVIRGNPHFFIKGNLLKSISTDISWKEFKEAFEGKTLPLNELLEEEENDEKAPKVIFSSHAPVKAYEAVNTPLPILILQDRLGSFANLIISYKTFQVDYNEHSNSKVPLRNRADELSLEKDLFETAYIKKNVGSSHYYCPLDKVAKSIAFLIEIGWQIKDVKGNIVHLPGKVTFEADTNETHILIKGKISYDTFEANITDIAGAFNRRERFLEIQKGHLSLLPETLDHLGLNFLDNSIEIVQDTFLIKKNQIGMLSQFFESNPLTEIKTSLIDLKEHLSTFKSIETTLQGKNFLGILRDYQQIGLNWLSFLKKYGFHGILADDMGLGKTVQVIAFLSTLEAKLPILIVMPTSLIFNWKKELERFLPTLPCLVHHGANRKNPEGFTDFQGVILTSYTTLRIDFHLFSNKIFECVILDEAQAIKNKETQISQLTCKLQATFRLSITGTPIENNLLELWSHFHFLMPDLLGEQKKFEAQIQAGVSDARYFRLIQKKCRPFMLRRLKEEVAKDLPEKIEQIVFVEMEEKQRGVYETFLSGVRKNLISKIKIDGSGKHKLEILEALMRLRQICCHPLLVSHEETSDNLESAKLEALMQDIETGISEGRKILVYSQFTSMLKIISQRVAAANWKFVYLDGTTKDREKVVNQFQEDKEIPLFLISLKAGGVGLNLTSADYVFLYDPWWNNAIENQAIDRAHRIGRKETVIAKRYILLESIEEKMLKLKELKSHLADDLFDEEFVINKLSLEDLSFLFE